MARNGALQPVADDAAYGRRCLPLPSFLDAGLEVSKGVEAVWKQKRIPDHARAPLWRDPELS
jgi:hypothetical protein